MFIFIRSCWKAYLRPRRTAPLRFDPAPPPTDRDVARLLATIRTRILRLSRRRGVLAAEDASVANSCTEMPTSIRGNMLASQSEKAPD